MPAELDGDRKARSGLLRILIKDILEDARATEEAREHGEPTGIIRRREIRDSPFPPCPLVQSRVRHGTEYITPALKELEFQITPRAPYSWT